MTRNKWLEGLRLSVLGILVLAVLFPVYWMVSSSFKPAAELFQSHPTLLPNSFSTVWYRAIISQSNVQRYFVNSMVVAFSTMCISIAVTTLGAYSLTRFNFRGKKTFLLAILLSYIFPPILLMLPLYNALAKLGLVDSYLGVIFTHTTIVIPFSLWILKSYFKNVPVELEEAGLIDGLSRLGAFWRIIVPVTAPGILSVGLFSFILSWNEYLYASVFLTGPHFKTLPIGITEFIAQYDVRWGEIMATSVVTAMPVLVIFMCMQKYFVQGLTAGAVKQ
jgi:ABC-type glycerol-3-phosphate transport system permease component